MQIIDILFVIIAAVLIVIGIKRGLIGEIVRLIALVAGFAIAFLYYPEATRFVKFCPPTLANTCSFLLIYIGVALGILGIGWIIKKIVHLTPLGWADYVFGGLIGLIKAAVIFWVVCLSISTFPARQTSATVNRSIVYSFYKKLPPGLTLKGITTLRSGVKLFLDNDAAKKINGAKQHLEQFKGKVDSAKHSRSSSESNHK